MRTKEHSNRRRNNTYQNNFRSRHHQSNRFRMSSSANHWSYRLGVIAWAPSPFSQSKHQSTAGSSSTTNAGDLYDWPCILYPSWSKAMTQSGIITDEKLLKLIGCKKPIAVKDLGKNTVPQSQALGSGLSGSGFRPKIVVHYLGLGEEASWGSAQVTRLKKYTLDSCCKRLMSIRENLKENNGSALSSNDQHELLYLAMQEASIVMGQPHYNPKNVCDDFDIRNISEYEKKSTKRKDAQEDRMTPENFDDWRLGGNTQGNSESQTQNFSQGILSTTNP